MFTIVINLGNDAMGTPDDVAQALKEIARKLEVGYTDGTIRDYNGNAVGRFDFKANEQ